MRARKRKGKAKTNGESGQAMSEYIVVTIALTLALIAATNAVSLLIAHHDRASVAMQLPL